jgi:hypothetical protein
MAKMVDSNARNETADAWVAFERAVDVVVKAPPMHRTKAVTPKPKPKTNTIRKTEVSDQSERPPKNPEG